MVRTFKLISSHTSFLCLSEAFLTFLMLPPLSLPSSSRSEWKWNEIKKRKAKKKREKRDPTDVKKRKIERKFCQAMPPPQSWAMRGDLLEGKGTFNEQALYWSVDKTVVNYVRGGHLIEGAKQGPCLLSDCVVRNDERLIDSRATGVKDKTPSLSLCLFLSPTCTLFSYPSLPFVSGRLSNPLSSTK